MKNFTIKELCRSDKANELGIANNPTPVACDNLIALTENVLDPVREHLGKPIHVNSGYRCAQLNEAVGGSKTSQHGKGEAADIELGGKTKEENKQLYEFIRDNCDYDQLINEYNFSWVHVSYRKGSNRKRELVIG